MKYLSTLLIIIITVLSGCSSSQKVTSSWVSPNLPTGTQYKTIFIAVMSSRQSIKTKMEDEFANFLTQKGYKAIKSSDVFPPSFTAEKMPEREDMLGKIRQSGSDAIFTVTLVDQESETRYIPGAVGYQPFVGYGRRFWGYYNYWFPYAYDPGYVTTDKTYFLEGNLFDVKSEELMWSVQTEAYNPSSIEDFSKGYAKLLWQRAEKELRGKR
ncbi:hypothetical protein [Gynurincola endophyticus]|uniref:hypothetical protein n=1 Tax=Gynurincola endophyticus TaxID=2479004 RepID=UPI000F8EB38D|nr:hypothetical protein [Gynurincola endophyticus]